MFVRESNFDYISKISKGDVRGEKLVRVTNYVSLAIGEHGTHP